MAMVNVGAAESLSHAFLRAAHGKPKPEVEMALVMAYAAVADGVGAFPAASRDRRAWRFVLRGMQALVDAIAEIAGLSEAQLAAEERAEAVRDGAAAACVHEWAAQGLVTPGGQCGGAGIACRKCGLPRSGVTAYPGGRVPS